MPVNRLVAEVLREAPSLDQLLDLLQELSGRSAQELRQEITEHVAARVAFLLLGDALGTQNYLTLEARMRTRLAPHVAAYKAITKELAQTAAWIEAAHRDRKTSLRDLPYPVRQRLFKTQNNRCGVCGWSFLEDLPAW